MKPTHLHSKKKLHDDDHQLRRFFTIRRSPKTKTLGYQVKKKKKNYTKLFIRKSKTDQTNQGNWVIIVETKSNTCPVNILKDYIQCMYIQKAKRNQSPQRIAM